MTDTKWPSKYFTLAEMTASETARERGIDNTPTDAVLAQLARTAVKMDRVRQLLSRPVRINSGYRSQGLNALVRGSPNSQHLKGEAVDFVCDGWSVIDIAKAIVRAGIVFDQIIFEGSWIHISFVDDPANNRRQVLTAHFGDGRVTYTEGLRS